MLHVHVQVCYITLMCLSSTTVVGQEELDSQAVNVRNRDDVGTKAKGKMVSLDIIAAKLVELKCSKSLKNEFL